MSRIARSIKAGLTMATRGKLAVSLAGAASLALIGGALALSQPSGAPAVGPNAIGGVVTGPAGPEAGVWVIAETGAAGHALKKIVVTDDRGRFVVPDLPKGTYKLWSRGYGLADSKPLQASPGHTARLKVTAAASAAEAAQIYPASYWLSLIHVPDASEFPGTGPEGNHIAKMFNTQQDWVEHMKENCQFCHTLGTTTTRSFPFTPAAIWNGFVHSAKDPATKFFKGDKTYRDRDDGARMDALMKGYGDPRGLEMFGDWAGRIAKGEAPGAPERPTGVERNIVVTLVDAGSERFSHDSISTDPWNPTVNANGPISGVESYVGMVLTVDPKTGQQKLYKELDARGQWGKNLMPHTATMDWKGRVWVADMTQYSNVAPEETGPAPAYCYDPKNKYAKYFPLHPAQARAVTVIDPATGKNTFIPLCFGVHHLGFDQNGRLYFSGDTQVVGWIDVKVWDRTHDAAKAVGWYPMVLDTNGDGAITPDKGQWNRSVDGQWGGEGVTENWRHSFGINEIESTSTAFDPAKDTRIAGMIYGMAVSPVDQSFWGAKYTPPVPSGILHLIPGPNPPMTSKMEIFEPPKVGRDYAAFNTRGVAVDSAGVVWVAFGSGELGRFDRSKCKTLNGPSATGQQCPEGWEIIKTPGPLLKGTEISANWHYNVFVDRFDTLGLGKDVPIVPVSNGDELLAYLPKQKTFVHLRIPYPVGFYARGMDGRIDDAKAGWKGRGIWASQNAVVLTHQEASQGAMSYMAHFQLRPNPLAQ
jgi:hypothetical protein